MTESLPGNPNNAVIIEADIPKDNKGRIIWFRLEPENRVLVIRQKAQQLLSENQSLSRQDAKGLLAAARKYYPGGVIKFRADLRRKRVLENHLGVPQLVHERSGGINWRLPGNTDEENLKLGIKNMQTLFLQRFPEFSINFPLGNDGRIETDKAEEAGEFILEKAGSKEKFLLCFGHTSRVRKHTPYFDGSWITAVKKSFQPWGIEIPFRVVDKETGTWTDTAGQNWSNASYFVKKFNLNRQNSKKFFEGVKTTTGFTENHGQSILYNVTEVEERISQFLSPPQVNTSDVFTDTKGKTWASRKYLCSEFGIGNRLLGRFLTEVASMSAITSSHLSVILYDREQIEVKLKDNIILPAVDEATGEYVDPNDRRWVTLATIAALGPVATQTVQRRLGTVASIKGKDRSGRETLLYDLAEGKIVVSGVLQLPMIDRQSDRYIDKEGTSWITSIKLAKETGIPALKLRSILADIQLLEGRSKAGNVVLLYPEELGKTILREKIADLPTVDRKSGKYTDLQKQSWVVADKTIFGEFGLSENREMLKGVPFIEGRGKNGQAARLYDEFLLRERLSQLSTLPQADKKTGSFTDETGEDWASTYFFAKELNIRSEVVRAWLRSKQIPYIRGRNVSGQTTNLYNVTATRKILQEYIRLNNPKEDSLISPEEANQQLRKLLEGEL